MDETKYKQLKTANAVTLSKVDGGYYAQVTQFDPDTGIALSPLQQQLDLVALNKRVTHLNKHLSNINQLITDLEALQ